jgi:nitrite reductase (NADH) large subunit
VLYGTWAPASALGTAAGLAAASRPSAFHPLPRSNVLKVLGIDLFSVGRITAEPGDILIEEAAAESYLGLIFQEGILTGGILLGDASAAPEIKKAVETNLDCSNLLTKQPDARAVLDAVRATAGGIS